MGSVHIGKEGEREVGRFLLKNGYLAWRTQQNRGSVRDDESDDVSSGMLPEHMLVHRNGDKFLDGYYIDKKRWSKPNKYLIPLDKFTIIPNLRIEVKKGYENVKTHNKQFRQWILKLKEETPQGWMWTLFFNKKWSGNWKVCFEIEECRVITIDQRQTSRALPIIERVAKKLRQND